MCARTVHRIQGNALFPGSELTVPGQQVSRHVALLPSPSSLLPPLQAQGRWQRWVGVSACTGGHEGIRTGRSGPCTVVPSTPTSWGPPDTKISLCVLCSSAGHIQSMKEVQNDRVRQRQSLSGARQCCMRPQKESRSLGRGCWARESGRNQGSVTLRDEPPGHLERLHSWCSPTPEVHRELAQAPPHSPSPPQEMGAPRWAPLPASWGAV